jgi:glucans biosynthesis protein
LRLPQRPAKRPLPSKAARAAAVCAAALFACIDRADAFGFDEIAQQARSLASEPYTAPNAALPEALKNIGYDQYRDIRFKPEKALWRAQGLPFELQFFHVGQPQTDPVAINEVVGQAVRRIAFDAGNFDYGRSGLSPQLWADLGFAGFRAHTALNSAAYKDELVVFLGASYFRALGRGQRYGLSARGLAIDTVGGQREEFPRFVEFWVERPSPRAGSLVIHALLDSPRATGAYRFSVAPGEDTVIDVQARLYLRARVATLGVAPLTSMFLHGANQPRVGDFRPEVHDSDGLMVAADGQWLWRPLINPARPLVTSFVTHELAGFGLMQRDRNFASYQDTETRYEQRPSCWISPKGSWGSGRVELVQLPTTYEANDNIVAYWVPDRVPAPGEPLNIAYQMRWQGARQQHPPSGWTVQSRLGHGFVPGGQEPNARELQYVVDFDGPALRGLPADAAVDAVVTADASARIVERNAYRNPATGAWRMTVRIDRVEPSQPVEVRAFLRHRNTVLTETWTSIIPSV